MQTMQDIFNNPSFGMAELTEAINILPNNYGRVGQLGLFKDKPVRFRNITIEEKHGVLSLLQSKVPGAPSDAHKKDKRTLRGFTIPHIPYDDTINADEVQGIRGFGSGSEVKSVAEVIVEHLQSMRNKHSITLEYLRMGALKGIILDADGSELLNLYDEFEIAPKEVNFALGTSGTDVKRKCLEVVRHIEKNLRGEFMQNVRALVSPEFFDALTSHAKVKEAYNRWEDGRALRDDMRSGFAFGGIIFEEYCAEATDLSGNLQRFINANEGHCFPMGTSESFRTYYAPADFYDALNTLGKPIYAKQEQAQFDRGTNIHTQSNPLPLCLRPGVLVKITSS